jgi:CDP-glycerol glycerophosphotransferase (TagB/SpsB family)
LKKNANLIYGRYSQKKEGKIFVNKHDFENSPSDYKVILLGTNELKKIQKSSIKNKEIPELFSNDDESMWWFFYPELSEKFVKIISFIKNFSNFITEINPEVIEIQNDFNYIEIIKQIANKKNIPVKYSKTNYLKYQSEKKVGILARKYRARIKTTNKMKKRKKIYFDKKNKIPLVNNKLVFIGNPIFRRDIFDFNDGASKKNEFLFKDLIKLLGKDEFIGIDFFTHLSANNKVLEERIDSEVNWFPVEALFSNHKNSETYTKFVKKFEKILELKEFQKLFVFEDIEYWNEIFEQFKKFTFSYNLPYWLTVLDSLKDFFSKNKPKCIILLYESGPFSLAVLNSARKYGIKTIGVQHGMIYDYHRYYLQENFYSTENPYGFPFPDNFLLFGEISRQILIKNGYPEKNLTTFGNPTFFGLNKNKLDLLYNQTIKKFNFDKNKKYILFAPSATRVEPGSKYDYNIKILKKLLETFQNQNDYVVLMKPHPSENFSIYENLIKQYPKTSAEVLRSSILEAIIISSLMLSTFSTTIIDAMCLNKPVIQVKSQNMDIRAPYDGIEAVYLTSLEELPTSIQKLLNNKEITNRLLTNASKFIKDYYNIPISDPKANLEKIIYDTKENQ